MSNPYQSPLAQAKGEELAATLAALPPLQGMIRTLRIVVAALALGVIVFAGYAIYSQAGKPLALAGRLDTLSLIMLGFGASQAVLGIVLPAVVFRAVTAPAAAAARQFAALDPQTAKVLGIQMRLQTATIVGCAMFEGGAFANLVAYLFAGDLLNVIAAGVLLLGILCFFPLPGACERRIAAELVRQKEAEGLRSP
jgi:hypothetical protein